MSREDLLNVTLNITRRRVVQKSLNYVRRKLSAYFTSYKRQSAHPPYCTAPSAIGDFAKANNHATAAQLARRLLELDSDPKFAGQARRCIATGDGNPPHVLEIDQDDFTKLEACGASFKAAYKGSPAARYPYTDAAYLPRYKGQVVPLTELTEIGASSAPRPWPNSISDNRVRWQGLLRSVGLCCTTHTPVRYVSFCAVLRY